MSNVSLLYTAPTNTQLYTFGCWSRAALASFTTRKCGVVIRSTASVCLYSSECNYWKPWYVGISSEYVRQIRVSKSSRKGLDHRSKKAVALLGLRLQMSRSPYRETYWSRTRRWIIVRIFLIFDRFTVKICKQYLQTASASGGFHPSDPLPGLRPWTPLGDFPPPDPLGYSPKWTLLAPPRLFAGGLHPTKKLFILVGNLFCGSSCTNMQDFTFVVSLV